MKTQSRITRCRTALGTNLGILVVVTIVTGPTLLCADEASRNTKAPTSRALCGVGHCPLCCCDDYVRKPAPCVSQVRCCCADTYCPKPCLVLPCPANGFCPDDYCPKPRPTLRPPMANEWYKCVPAVSCPGLPRATGNPAARPESQACR